MQNRLRVLRAEREWSQADLAARLHVSRQTINAIETGKYDPSCRSLSASRGCSSSRLKRSLSMNPKTNPMNPVHDQAPAANRKADGFGCRPP